MIHKYLKNVVNLKLNIDKCVGCGICTLVCPHAVFCMKDGKAYIEAYDSCMECGACAKNCAFGAIDIKSGVG
jgi:NAD-dependent dihydropyrimidine dehydrogenase PreA subunit